MGIFVRKKNPVDPGSIIGPRQMSWTGGLETIDLSPTLLNMVAELGTVTLNYGGLSGDNTDEGLQFGLNPDRAFGKSATGKWEITTTALIWRDANNVITRQISSGQSAFVFEYASNNAGVAVVAGVSTFTPPVGWVSCHYKLIQGGAGGGSGRNAGTGVIRLGGTGGCGGLRSDGILIASQVPAGAWTITVGAGGAGGLGVTNNSGNNGGFGGATSVVAVTGSVLLAAASLTGVGLSAPNVGVGVGGDGSVSRSGTAVGGSGTAMWYPSTSGNVTSLANANVSNSNPQGGTSGPGGGSVEAGGFVWAPGTGNGGAQTGGVASNSVGGAAPTGTATGWGTGGAGSGGGTNVSAGAAGGNGTGGVAILVFSF